MSSKHDDDAETGNDRRPRNVAYEAREEAFRWYKRVLDAHQGTYEGSPERAQRKLHTAVLSYYRVLYQVRSATRAEITDEEDNDLWTDAPLFQHRGQTVTGLDSLQNWEFAREQQTVKQGSFGKPGSQQVKTRPAQLSVEQAAQALKLLDKAAGELGLRWAVDEPPIDAEADYELAEDAPISDEFRELLED